MRILTISNYYPEHLGGIEFVALNLVQHWRTRHQVRWMACDVKTHPHQSHTDDTPLPALNFAESRLGFPYPIPIGKSFFEILREVKYCDVVHIHDCLYLANILAFLASRWYGKPLFVTQHVALVPYSQAYKNILQKAAYYLIGRLVLGKAAGAVFISERVKAWFEGYVRFRYKPILIPNGVDRGLFYPPAPKERESCRAQLGFLSDDIVLLFVGRFTQKKGLGLIREIAKARTKLHWLMIGRDELNPRTWNLPNVQVLPPQSQDLLRKYYLAADLFVLPSVGEGFPLALQEALSCGLPVAAPKEIVYYVPDAPVIELDVDSLPALLQTLDNVIIKTKRLQDLRNEAADYAKHWDWENVARQYENLFVNLTPLH